MNKRLITIFLLLFCIGTTSLADIVYPARLEIRQTSDSTYEVLFVLPVIKGRVLRAQPFLPDGCITQSPPDVGIDNFAKTMRWVVTCTDLVGSQVGIEGLQGSQVDIQLSIEFLNGRILQTTLSPVKPIFIIPPPPSASFLASQGFTEGIRTVVSRILIALIFIIAGIHLSKKNWGQVIVVFLSGVAAGFILALNDLLLFPPTLLNTLLLLTAVLFVMYEVVDRKPPLAGGHVLVFCIALILGGSMYTVDSFSGFTNSDYIVWILGSLGGVGIGLLAFIGAAWLISRARKLRKSSGKKRFKWIWYLVGVVLISILVVDASLYFQLPAPGVSLLVVFFVLLIPFFLPPRYSVLLVLTSVLFGIILGNSILPLPFVSILPALAIVWFVIRLKFQFIIPKYIDGLIVLAAGISSGWILSVNVIDTLSYPEARIIGYGVLSIFYFILVSWIPIQEVVTKNKVIPWAAGILTVALSISESIPFAIPEWNEASSLGKLIIPLPALLLLIIAVVIWPRQRKIYKEMNVEKRSIGPAMLFLLSGICSFPFGWVYMNNPWASAQNMTDVQARTVVGQALTTTYTAFNLSDEDALFQELSTSIDESLIDEIYLDSRRRLNAGVREGAQVSVREVEVLDIVPKDSDNSDQVFETTWVVTARVKHLQHVHHRRNKYLGSITLRQGNQSWKIAGISLTSEDRTVIPAGSL